MSLNIILIFKVYKVMLKQYELFKHYFFYFFFNFFFNFFFIFLIFSY